MLPKHAECGGSLKVREEIIKSFALTSGATILMGFILSTPAGWLGLIPALMAGTPNVNKMLKFKGLMSREFNRAGHYFACDKCGRDVPLGEVTFN